MESPLEDFPSEPTSSVHRFAPVVESRSRKRRSRKRRRFTAALFARFLAVRAASIRASDECAGAARQLGLFLRRLPLAVDRVWHKASGRIETRREEPIASASLAEEITHIAHDAGLTQDGLVASLQRAVAETVEREAARRTTPDRVSTPPRLLAVAVSAALIAGVAYGIMWQQRPWSVVPPPAVTTPAIAESAPLPEAPIVVQPQVQAKTRAVPVKAAAATRVVANGRPRSNPRAVANLTDGELLIVTEPPGARVTVDGVGRGVTPLTLRNLAPGAKRVRVTKDGYTGAERVVSLAQGTTEHTVRIPLERRQ